MLDIIVPEYPSVRAGTPDALDHRSMIQLIGIYDEAGQDLSQRRECRLIRDIAGREQQGACLAVQLSQFTFQIDMKACRA